ncbi:hypothetical protein R3P38DRAFT_2518924, partial [Favolaschia claudopus]
GERTVVNKDLMRTENIRTQEIIPGRAMLIEIETHEEKEDEPRRLRTHEPGVVRLLGVYAPNAPAENALFWKTLREFFEQNPHLKPDIFGGDMNVVEEAIDRLPSHKDSEEAVMELDLLKSHLGMIDGWRHTFPTTRDYTFNAIPHRPIPHHAGNIRPIL